MVKARHVQFATRLIGVLHVLHPEQANRRPTLFMVEIAAALLSVLALRDGLSGGRVVTETFLAIGLWGLLLALASGATIRKLVAQVPYRGRSTKSSRG